MYQKLFYVSVILLICLSLLLFACGQASPPPSAATVLTAMQAAMEDTVPPPPDGKCYDRSASPDASSYLGDTLISALYGETARGLLVPEIDGTSAAVGDAAIFLSVAPHPGELAVLRCSDARGTTTAAGICRARLDLIRRAWAGTEYEALTARAVVTVEDSFVLLIVAEDPEAVIDAARRAIRAT